jgi:hypothetical protein
VIGDAQDNMVVSPSQQVVLQDGITDTPASPGADTPRIMSRQIAPSTSRGIQQLGGSNIVSDAGEQQIRVSDDTSDRVLLGAIGDGEWGLKVSVSGVDVTTASDDDLLFDSTRNTFKILSTGTATLTVTGTGQFQVEIPHNLGYTPAFLAFVDAGAGFRSPLPAYVYNNLGAITAQFNIVVNATYTRLYIDNLSTATPFTERFRYYLLQQTAN